MKRLLFLLLVLFAVCARAANPAFQDFNTNQFTTSANKVTIKSGWTNNTTHIWPSGSGISGTAAKAPIAIRYDGSIFIGTNAAEDIGSAFTSGDTFMRALHAVSYVNSNSPSKVTIYGVVADDLNYTYFSDILIRFDGSPSAPISRMEFNAVGTNASRTARMRLFLDPSLGGLGTQFSINEDGADRIALQPNIADGASAIAFLLNSRRLLVNAGAKLFSLQNTNAEKFSVSAAGTASTIALKVGTANQATITNILSGSATLNFASQSLGGSEDLPITVTGAADGDAVSLGYESTVATGIIGSYSAWASNGVVFVRFIATAATQNPNSGVFKVVVTKF